MKKKSSDKKEILISFILEKIKEYLSVKDSKGGLVNLNGLYNIVLQYKDISQYTTEYDLIIPLAIKINNYLRNNSSEEKVLIDEIIKPFIEEISHIPNEYNFFFQFPMELPKEINEIAISDDISLGKIENIDELVLNNFSKDRLLRAMTEIKGNTTLKKDSVFLKITSKGYIGYNMHDSITFQDAYLKLKSFVYIGTLRGLLKYQSWKGAKESNLLFFYKNQKQDKIKYDNYPMGLEGLLSKIEIPDESFEIYYRKGIFLGGKIIDKKDAMPKERVEAFVLKCSEIIDYINLRCKNNKKDGKASYKEKIDASIEWAFESIINHNETFSFIQICIGIEAIISDSENLRGKIENRIAYMLGETEVERIKLLKEVEKIFKIRNNLVHGTKIKLDEKEKGFLKKARLLLDRIISREVFYLVKESKR